ncbi:hypothetical protein BDV98DRAFT_518580, partial [Pterulicium gracile]
MSHSRGHYSTPGSSFSTSSSSSSTSFQPRNPLGQSSKGYWSNHRCRLCKRLGHGPPKCPLLEEAARVLARDLPSRILAGNSASGRTPPPSSPHSIPTKPLASQRWMADSGASAHMTSNRHWLSNIRPHRQSIQLADGSVVYSTGIGELELEPL